MSNSPVVTLTTNTLHQLLRPVVPLACRDEYLPGINAVLLERVGDYLTATATDRFRVGAQRVKLEGLLAGDFHVGIRLEQVNTLLTLFKATRKGYGHREVTVDLRLERGKLVIEQHIPDDEVSELRAVVPVMDNVMGASFPDLHGLITKTIGSQVDEQAPDHWGISLELLTGFREAAKRNSKSAALWFHRPKSRTGPILLAAGDDFVGMIMPKRFHDERDRLTATEALNDWAGFLTVKTTEPSVVPSSVEEQQGKQLEEISQ